MASRHSNVGGSVSHFSDTEDMSTNLSSKQVWDTLTDLLYLTMKPLALQTQLTDDLLYLILASSVDQRRKISAFDSSISFDYCYRLMFLSPDTVLVGLLRGIGVERTVFSELIRDYLNGSYRPHTIGIETMDLGYGPRQLEAYTSDFYDLYLKFRTMVTDRFKKLSMSQAAKNKWLRDQFGLTSDLADNEQNFYLAVIRAVDKFYPEHGTIANYVILWLQNAAGSSYTLYTGEAFNLTRPVRKQIHDGTVAVNNKAYSLDRAVSIEDGPSPALQRVEDSSYLAMVASLQQTPSFALVFLLTGYPLIESTELNAQLAVMFGDDVKLPKVNLSDLPPISLPTRASRKDSPDHRRRRESISERKKKRAKPL